MSLSAVRLPCIYHQGARAAQVVPHVHFHIIPRPAEMAELKNKSWSMFGRGQREELDEDEAEALAAELREELAKIVEGLGFEAKARL
jgi:diadenosine tetraphosphate (Ap4A) HIT family hydrolase